MKITSRSFVSMGLLFGVALGACVTVNIYFPAEKVESVAGEIVRDIRGEGSSETQEPSGKDSSSLWNSVLFAFTPSSAWAQDVTDVSNATIRALKDRMKARFAEMMPYYRKGALTEGADGYVAVGSEAGLSLKEKRDVRAMMDAENQDRRQLYQEVAKALDIDPGDIGRVAEIFAGEWRKSVR